MSTSRTSSTDLRQILDGVETESIRQKVREIISRPEFLLHHYISPKNSVFLDENNYSQHVSGTGGGEEVVSDLPTYRETVFQWLGALAKEGLGLTALLKASGGQENFAAFVAIQEIVAFHDISLAIKFAVQFSLWGGSIQQLGTQKHHEKYLNVIGTLKLPGCFAMTEIGHGSNVRDIETVAEFDRSKNEFIIHSPTFTSGKNYIGNAACHGRAATVFAQLQIEGSSYGVHAFVVPIRDENGQVLHGITIEDNGPKMGENGVDNARMWFNKIRIPKDNLLDRFAQIDQEGNYHSKIEKSSARFLMMLSTLVGGRIVIATTGLSAAKSGLTIAVRYAAYRRQFKAASSDTQEMRLLDYPTHQRRLLPLIANVYAYHFALKDLTYAYVNGIKSESSNSHAIEVLAAALKASTTWNTTATLQTCREACGGEGYMSANRLPSLKSDSDIFTTFEGDNTVLTVWAGRNLLNNPPAELVSSGLDWTKNKDQELPFWETPANQVQALLFRAQTLLQEVQAKVVKLQNEKAESHKVQLELQWPLFHLAQAYTEYHIVDCFVKMVDKHNSQNCLQLLQQLFVFSTLEKHRAWFLEHSAISPKVSSLLQAKVDTLCAELTPYAVELVDAFGIPETSLAAPIARKG